MKHKYISNFSLHISEHSSSLSSMEHNMVKQLLKNKEKLKYEEFTIVNIAHFLNVSTTSLHRLSKKLGYSSFIMMKEDFFHQSQSTHQISKYDYISMLSSNFELVESSLNDAIIEKVALAKRLTIYGMGMSRFIAEMFQIKLQLLGIDVQQYNDSRYMKLSSQYLDPKKDVVIVLSRSGCPPELIQVMMEVNQKNVTSLLITESKESPLKDLATYVINTAYTLDDDKHIDTRILTHMAMDLLIQRCLSKREDYYEK